MVHPTHYKPEYCDLVKELGRNGKSVVQMACHLGVVKQTIYNWKAQNPEFKEAMGLAFTYSQGWWEDIGQEALKFDKFQQTLWAKQVSCRFPDDYREKTIHMGDKDSPLIATQAIDTSKLTTQELIALKAALNATVQN